ncbi:MAG: (2Fe-2S) ferredoxin domain-containing protein [Deltaproteobacteria bacterium]|nr:(2Fe-2S) ferredoxin domain-containing protein [Deltaproteobacteria bacterium]
MPLRDRYLWVCTNRRPDGHPKGSCAEKGSENLKDLLKQALHAAGLHEALRVCTSGCIDLCERGITVALEPDHVLLGGVTAEDVPALVEALKSPGGLLGSPLASKVLTAENTEAPRKAPVFVGLGPKRRE